MGGSLLLGAASWRKYLMQKQEKKSKFEFDIETADNHVRTVSFSPDGRYLATGGSNIVRVWDIQHGKTEHLFVDHTLDIYSLKYSSDGRFIVSGSGDHTVKIWDIEKGLCAHTLGKNGLSPLDKAGVGARDGITSVAISPDGRTIAATSLDRCIYIWDAHTGSLLEKYIGHTDSVYAVAFSPDGKSIVSGALDNTLKLWDLPSLHSKSQCVSTFAGHQDFVLSVAFSPYGTHIIKLWDTKNTTALATINGHKKTVISVAHSPLGNMFLTGSADFTARLWKYEL